MKKSEKKPENRDFSKNIENFRKSRFFQYDFQLKFFEKIEIFGNFRKNHDFSKIFQIFSFFEMNFLWLSFFFDVLKS